MCRTHNTGIGTNVSITYKKCDFSDYVQLCFLPDFIRILSASKIAVHVAMQPLLFHCSKISETKFRNKSPGLTIEYSTSGKYFKELLKIRIITFKFACNSKTSEVGKAPLHSI